MTQIKNEMAICACPQMSHEFALRLHELPAPAGHEQLDPALVRKVL